MRSTNCSTSSVFSSKVKICSAGSSWTITLAAILVITSNSSFRKPHSAMESSIGLTERSTLSPTAIKRGASFLLTRNPATNTLSIALATFGRKPVFLFAQLEFAAKQDGKLIKLTCCEVINTATRSQIIIIW